MIDEKMRKKWDDHIAKCKIYVRRENYPGEDFPYKFHYESEIAIDDYLRELERACHAALGYLEGLGEGHEKSAVHEILGSVLSMNAPSQKETGRW